MSEPLHGKLQKRLDIDESFFIESDINSAVQGVVNYIENVIDVLCIMLESTADVLDNGPHYDTIIEIQLKEIGVLYNVLQIVQHQFQDVIE